MNVKLSSSRLNKLESALKNETDVVLRLSSNMIDNSDNNINFPHKVFLTNRQVANFRKAFANHTSTDIKLSKTQLSKMVQLGGFIRAGYGSKRPSFKKKLIPPHPLTNFEIQTYYQNEPRFNGIYSRDN